ncbi:hypothetical protein KFK09_020692 [Dendrobium nobile]|uniref:Integrase zinc-binding domain-containing protein n=1 Tax=Dendrobium nobile TaxID=94219 RepID=A0A8T3AN62_DENNO|nr:hypothetical protein KFK09_020692 [Dendrobium nobile]
MAVSVPMMRDWEAIKEESARDEELGKIRADLLKEVGNHPGYSLDGERLLYQGRFVLPRTSIHIPHLLQEFHGNAVGGHSGVLKTYRRLAVELYWKGMHKNVEEMVSRCEVCQRNKYLAMLPGGYCSHWLYYRKYLISSISYSLLQQFSVQIAVHNRKTTKTEEKQRKSERNLEKRLVFY